MTNPKDYTSTLTMLQDWIKAETDKVHSTAVKYIEENVDLIDTDLEKFMDDCPRICQLEVSEMLLKAGIDLKDYLVSSSLKQWINKYILDKSQYCTIDYKKQLDDYIEKTITYKPQYMFDSFVVDTMPVVNEA